MRRIALNSWYGGLILLVVWGLFTALVAAVERFFGRWHAPGLITLLLVVALDAIITQRLVARERQRPEEQAGVRVLELVVIILLVRLWSLAAEGRPLLETVGPWLRSPLQFFGGRFGEYFLWALAAWGCATLLTSDVIGWGDDAPLALMPEGSIERDQIQHEWDQVVARYDRRYLLIAFMTLVASGFALYGIPLFGSQLASPRVILTSAAAITVLVAGMLLHSSSRLSQLRRNWSVDNIEVDPGISRRWSRSGVLIMIGLVLVAPLLGWVVLIAPPPPLIPVANVLLAIMTIAVSLVVLLIGLLLAPLILLLSLLSGRGGSAMPALPRFEPPQIAESTGERPLVPALIFWGCVLLLIGITLVRYVQGRSDLRAALHRWRFLSWLLNLTGEWWSDARGWAALATTRLRRLARSRSRVARPPRPRGAQAQLRALYRRMQEAGSRRGISAEASQTPYEYGAELERSLPRARQDVQGLTETYVVAEYGPRPAGPSDLRVARRHWRRLQRWLLQSRGLRRRTDGSGLGDRGTGADEQ